MRAWVRAAGLILSLGLICGCSRQVAAPEDLVHALREAHSAVASSNPRDRAVRPATNDPSRAETLLGDIEEQIVDAERALEPVSSDSGQTQSERDAAFAAVHAGVAPVPTSRDQLQKRGAVDNAADLASAGRQVDAVLGQLRGSQ